MPIAATSHSVAAVVSPRTERPWRMIAPAPRKPMPLTICAAMRDGSCRTRLRAAIREEVVEAEGGDEREERGADGHEQMRSKTRLTLAQLPLEADGPAEQRRDGQSKELMGPARRGHGRR